MNLPVFAGDVALQILVFRWLLPSGVVTGPAVWLPVFAGLAAGWAWSSIALTLLISLREGFTDRRLALLSSLQTLAVSLVGAAFALATVTLYVVGPANVLLVWAGLVAISIVYRAYAQARRRLAKVDGLYRFALFLASTSESSDDVIAALGQVRSMLQATDAELVIQESPTTDALQLLASDGGGPAPERARVLRPGPVTRSVLRTGRSVLLGRRSADDAAREELAVRGFSDAIIVPLRTETRTIGTVAVLGRLGDLDAFDRDDVRLVEALSSHLALWLEHGRLLARLREAVAERERQALTDMLTGLPNRRQFVERATKAIRMYDADAAGAVLLLDLDRFKEVNDTLGHAAGDQLLCAVADRLAAAARSDELIARLGGDEFAVLLPKADADEAFAAGRRYLGALSEALMLDDVPLAMEGSVGVALFPADGEDVFTVLRRADVAMYAAKTSGSQLERYSPKTDKHSRSRLAILADLRTAIDEEELTVYFQPKVDLRTGLINGSEALVRWPRPGRGMMKPDLFIPQAEQSGLMGPLTRHVLGISLEHVREWWERGGSIGVSVNLSARNLIDPTLPDVIDEMIHRTGVPAHAVTFELTESAVIANPARAAETLRRLRDTGFKLSLDDFGTGQASLQLLRSHPFTEVKIDRSFVQGMLEDDDDAAIVSTVINLGHWLGLRVVAEGVSKQPMYDRLVDLGCDDAQGYLLGKPMPGAQLTERLFGPLAGAGLDPVSH